KPRSTTPRARGAARALLSPECTRSFVTNTFIHKQPRSQNSTPRPPCPVQKMCRMISFQRAEGEIFWRERCRNCSNTSDTSRLYSWLLDTDRWIRDVSGNFFDIP